MLRASYCLSADDLRAACDQVAGDLYKPLPKQEEHTRPFTWFLFCRRHLYVRHNFIATHTVCIGCRKFLHKFTLYTHYGIEHVCVAYMKQVTAQPIKWVTVKK